MEAVGQTEGRQTRRFTLLQVGQAYLNHLLEQKEFEQAGRLCQKILGKKFNNPCKSFDSFESSTLLHCLTCETRYFNTQHFSIGTDKRLWEEEVFKFARIHQLRAVSPYLPRGDHRLESTIYEMVLYEFLKLDAKVRKH